MNQGTLNLPGEPISRAIQLEKIWLVALKTQLSGLKCGIGRFDERLKEETTILLS